MDQLSSEPVLSIGALAPDFTLPDLKGTPHRLGELLRQVTILNFWSAECPWSARADAALKPLLVDWEERVLLLTIASNANETPEWIRQVSYERGLPLVLHDAHQQVADRYRAQTTPHLFVIDNHQILRYQGAFDDVTFRQRVPGRAYLRDAVEALLSGFSPDPAQTPPYGCTIVRYPA